MTTDDEAALLKAVIESPDDDAPRLAYANWCDRRGDPRGRFIRVQLELAKVESELGNPNRQSLEIESQTLLDDHGQGWVPSQHSLLSNCIMHRGFLAGVTITATTFMNRFPELSHSFPIQFVNITNLVPHARTVLTSPNLNRLSALGVSRGQITDEDMAAFAQCPFAHNLWWLDLSDNQVSQLGVEALITSPFIKKLGVVSLSGNPCNPVEVVGFDQGSLVYSHMPEVARKLEAHYGPIPWLNYREDTCPLKRIDKR